MLSRSLRDGWQETKTSPRGGRMLASWVAIGASCDCSGGFFCVPSVHAALCAVHTSESPQRSYNYYTEARPRNPIHSHCTPPPARPQTHRQLLTVVAGAQTYGRHCVRNLIAININFHTMDCTIDTSGGTDGLGGLGLNAGPIPPQWLH